MGMMSFRRLESTAYECRRAGPHDGQAGPRGAVEHWRESPGPHNRSLCNYDTYPLQREGREPGAAGVEALRGLLAVLDDRAQLGGDRGEARAEGRVGSALAGVKHLQFTGQGGTLGEAKGSEHAGQLVSCGAGGPAVFDSKTGNRA